MQLIPTADSAQTVSNVTADTASFVALSRFTIARMTERVKQAFQQRPHRVDHAAGFVRMEVISPHDAPNEIWLFTYWKDESSYRTWHHSHLYQESHQGIPKGLRLVPKSVSIKFFEHVAS
jgi:heme oxygenase (mycobilin-producing)